MAHETEKPTGPLTYGKTEEEAALYREITKRLTGAERSVYDLLMMMVFNPDQARVFLAYPPATVAPMEEIAQKTGFSKEFIEDTCQELYEKGFMVKTRRGWAPTRSSIQAVDTGPTQKWADVWGDGFFQLLRAERLGAKDMEGGRSSGSPVMKAGSEYPMFKVYPHIKALYMSGFKDEDILDIEDYREDFKKVNAIATIYCCCRRLSWGAKDYPQGYVCVCFNRGAEYQVERGSAIMRTPDEMLELEENLCIPHWDMYTASNMTAKQDYICNCGVEVGGCIWGGPIATGELRDAFAPSRYQAVVDPLKCKSCRLCVDNCNVHAINLKQYPDGTAKAWVDPDVCMGCGCCVVNCPNGAREMILVRPPEFIIQRDSMPTGRYDTPEKYIEVADLTAGLKEGRRKRDKEMEDKWCAKHRVNRNPYGIQA